MSHFDTNLAALAKVDALLYLALKSFKPNQHYEVFMDNDPANYNIIDTKNTKAISTSQSLLMRLWREMPSSIATLTTPFYTSMG